LSATNGQEAVNLIQTEYDDVTEESESSSPRISLILMDCAMVSYNKFVEFIDFIITLTIL
jgi:hypothetical protein